MCSLVSFWGFESYPQVLAENEHWLATFFPKQIMLLSVPFLYLEKEREMTVIYPLTDYWILRCEKLFAFVKHLVRIYHHTNWNKSEQLPNQLFLSWSAHFGHLKQFNQLDQPFWDTNWLLRKPKHQIGCFFLIGVFHNMKILGENGKTESKIQMFDPPFAK